MPKDKILIENINHPGLAKPADAAMYTAMRKAYLAVTPKEAPGMTAAAIRAALEDHLPQDLFPGGAKAGWWAKAVQLDLEAKGLLIRDKSSPLRFRKL